MVNPARSYVIKVNEAEGQLEIDETAAALLKDSKDGVVLGDSWGYISDVNDVIVQMYQARDKSEFVGKHVLEFLVKEDRERAVRESLDSIVTGQGKKLKYQIQLKNGTTFTVEVTTDCLKNRQGEDIGFIDIVRKISDL
jgi:PAS domain S-box-containing protein